MKKILLLLILMTLPTILPFFNPRFFYTQDYIYIARQQQMDTVLSDGQFPARWAPDLRFGEPIFNFYASLPFYIGSLIHLLGFNVIWTSKILFMLASVLSAVTMFIFLKNVFDKKAAFLGSLIYTYAPYRAVDIYVRGAISEAWAFVFFPLIFYSSWLLAEKMTLKRIAFLALSLAGLFLTHNVTTLMFVPFLALWWIYLAVSQKSWKVFLPFFASGVLAGGVAATFLLPAMFERQFIQTQYLIVGYFNFRAHFVAVSQFFSTFWGYGSSLWGIHDGLSFQVGLANWAIIVLSIVFGTVFRKDKKTVLLLGFLSFSFLLSLFFQHNKSAPIWEAIALAAFIQFPWRFLAISVFIVGIIGAVITQYLTGKLKYLYFVLIGAVILASIFYFRPEKFVDDSFFEKFLDPNIMRTGRDLTKDYLPIWVKTVDGEVFNTLKAESGMISVTDSLRRSTIYQANVKVASDAAVVAPVTAFPGWQVRANGRLIDQSEPSQMGLIRFKLPKGNYSVKIEFKNTPVRILGNSLSAVSLLLIGFLLFYKRKSYK